MTPSHPSLPYGRAVCYSGYRRGQSPVTEVYPSADEVRDDLRLLAPGWDYLRLYDCSRHAELVLEAIRSEGLPLRVMLGGNLRAEASNPGCPWGGLYDDATLAANRAENEAEMDRLVALARAYPEIACAASIGNEASVGWTDHLVPVERLVGYAEHVKAGIAQPVTFCENYVPWTGKLAPLAAVLDVISVHTYPVWEYQPAEAALAYTDANVRGVAERYPDTPVVVTEAGWTTASNGRGIEPGNASPALQAAYVPALLDWARETGVLTFVFEAFDEPWKGSADPREPEKHWGLYTVDREPKPVVGRLLETV